MYDSALLESPPRSMRALLDVAKANPGRVTYPQPPSFHGTTFLKQALLELMPGEQRELLAAPVVDDAQFASLTAPLWDYLDALHPLMWAQGERQPAGAEEQIKTARSAQCLDRAELHAPGSGQWPSGRPLAADCGAVLP